MVELNSNLGLFLDREETQSLSLYFFKNLGIVETYIFKKLAGLKKQKLTETKLSSRTAFQSPECTPL